MKKILARLALISFALITAACGNKGSSAEASSMKPSVSSDTSISSVEKSSSSSTSSKTYSSNYQLSTASGLKVYFKEQGARIDKIEYNGKQIAKDGFTVGRVANRIANAKFTLNGTQYNVTPNDRPNSLHGGGNSWQGPFATANWKTEEQTASSVKYKIVSADKDNGYPGEMTMYVTYTLTEAGELSIEYSATTTKDTLCNPTNHLFIDINGNRSYNNVKLQINADSYNPLNNNKIPTGEIKSVAGTNFDYLEEKTLKGDRSIQYDHNYVLNHTTKGDYMKAATLTGTQYKVDVYTDRPGMQLYKDDNGNVCLETQMLPDAINHTEFDEYGTTILRAGETFTSKTTYYFSKVGA